MALCNSDCLSQTKFWKASSSSYGYLLSVFCTLMNFCFHIILVIQFTLLHICGVYAKRFALKEWNQFHTYNLEMAQLFFRDKNCCISAETMLFNVLSNGSSHGQRKVRKISFLKVRKTQGICSYLGFIILKITVRLFESQGMLLKYCHIV